MSAAERAVELAVAAAGNRDKDWARRVYDNLAEISVMLREGSEIMEWSQQIADAQVFKVEYRGVEEEIPQGMNRPTRLIVHTQSDKAINSKPGSRQNLTGEETIRTHPLWTKPGRLVAERIRDVPVGSEILMYKHMEQVDGDRKVRVLVHFEVLRRARPDQPATQERHASTPHPPAAPPDQPPAPNPLAVPEAHSHGDNKQLGEIERMFDALDSRKRVAYGRWAAGHGISNPMLPEPEQMQAALDVLNGLAAKEE